MKSLNFSGGFFEVAGDVASHMPDGVVDVRSRALTRGRGAGMGA